ncbi:MAG TPA: ABC-type transport auxiliary lipoprotein family protein [Ramlibacter sp.]|nr:ABC-type transport auxiliary lipoprotein family protein [Ramlibacter sp.]
MMRRLVTAVAALLLAACNALPDKPVREVHYDFGPGTVAEAAAAAAGAPLVLAELEVSASLETSALLYRLAYADPRQLRAYAFAAWSAPPGQLLRQRLREHLALERPVLDASAGAAIARRGGAVPPVLRVELEEFSHVFDSQTDSKGLLRLRCTLMENTPAGERLVAQRSFTVQRPATSADAAGGVRALSEAAETAALEVAAWLRQAR